MDKGQTTRQDNRADDAPERALLFVLLSLFGAGGVFIFLLKQGIFR